MLADYVIVGQGICGTLLSRNLIKEGKKVVVIDEPRVNSSSKVASGVINPVTGRRIVRTWLIEDLLPFAAKTYREIEDESGVSFMRQCNVLNFHATRQMRDAFDARITEGETYLRTHDENNWKPYLNFIYGVGEVDPCLLIDLNTLINTWRDHLQSHSLLIEDKFDVTQLVVSENSISYKGIAAEKIIFCDGVSSSASPYFGLLPFARNKGEALIVSIPGLPQTNILKQGISLVPWKEELFWVGSSYQWVYDNDLPTEGFRVKTQHILSFLLKVPFTVEDHIAAERPATIERRPFVGLHPVYSSIGIFNGMGTKGCSLAPYFARQLSRKLVYGEEIDPSADVQRFKRILSSGKQ